MKANIRQTTQDRLVVRGIELEFNSLHEKYIRREGEVTAQIEEKYPGALDALNVKVDFDDAKNGMDVADRYEAATKACGEYFDVLFGEGTGAKLLGDDPYFGLAVQVFTEYKAEIMKQGLDFGVTMGKTLTKYEPVGPKGEKPSVK